MTIINDARITFVAGDCFTGHIGVADPDTCAFLDEWTYGYWFNQIRGGNAPDLAMPWRNAQKSMFWCHYLGGDPGNVSPQAAWNELVPLRLIRDPAAVATDQGERVVIDAFGYQFGVVVAITVHVAKSASLAQADWVDRLRSLRLGRAFSFAGIACSIEDLCGHLLDFYRTAFYPGAQAGTRSSEPLSINTVLQAKDGRPEAAISLALQRQLHAVTAWPNDWQNAVLPARSDTDVFLPMRGRHLVKGDVLYAGPRGRTVWRPGLFAQHQPTDGPRRRHTLSCLAHNLVAGAVQTEILRLLAVRSAGVPMRATALGKPMLRLAARKLEQLRAGKATFRSSSIQRHVEESSTKGAVNALFAQDGIAAIP